MTLLLPKASAAGADMISGDMDSDIVLHPTRLFTELDAYLAEDREVRKLDTAWSLSSSRQERDRQIDQSLRHAIRSFAARWLHLVPHAKEALSSHEDIVRELWRATRRDMLKVINRVSYRSVLTLFLFGLTPIPVGISEEEEMDGLTGQICVQTALQQVQRLRERQRNYQFNGTKVSLGSDVFSSPAPTSTFTRSFLSSESRAYWAALIIDTSASLTLNFRSSLTSGLHGVHAESSWRVLKMGTGSFHTRTQEWRQGTVPMTDDMVTQVIAAASAGNVYMLKMIAVLKEALREGYEDDKVAEAWTSCLKAMEIFKVTFRPLVNLCERRLPLLGEAERLNWYELMLHQHLGVLLLVDGVEAAERTDLLSQLREAQLDAERDLLDVIRIGLESTYTIRGPEGPMSGEETPAVLSASFVAVDPYPHHMVAAVQLMNKAVGREYKQGRITFETYKSLKQILLRTLEELPQTSKSVEATRRELGASVAELDRLLDDKSMLSEVVRRQPQHPAT
ncbi:hypothetical protein A1O1_06973 [Capronia coronata CBS 617.96]|uniref:Uncharacterized protein n=1 Tax=Capronia coronata CBS 617.96 TaxID=1182541 RepID=W9XS52_9EURO|nr:uncharacterized protein A1O1_06973 [Capronia coronata CBS 617.96]EXJ83352.1 hypothetical protein A1O1_06973 [Capronia coronata CBS 617.96]